MLALGVSVERKYFESGASENDDVMIIRAGLFKARLS